MRFIRRDSLFSGNLTKHQRIKRLLQLSAKPHYSDTLLSLKAAVHLPVRRFPLSPFLCMVETRLGSQPLTVKLVLDTGSSLMWMQCKLCLSCFRQDAPIYDSRASTSYHKLPCNQEVCQGDTRFSCVDNQCVYRIPYGGLPVTDRTPVTEGVASLESFQFPDDKSGSTVVKDMIFGCSNKSQNFGFLKGQVSGILGLGLAPYSLANQLGKRGMIDYRFSYCIAPLPDELRHGVLRFGNDIPRPRGILRTKYQVISGNNHYNMELLDISVGSPQLGFQPDMFKARQDGKGGCFIDQNTQERNAFQEVIKSFRDHYDSHGLKEEVAPNLPLCYRIKPGFQNFLAMTYHFKGAHYLVEGKYMHYYFNEDKGYFCVALILSSYTVLGAWQQQNKRLIYDLKVREVQWVTENCADDYIP
ncbi:hypothetical protein PTKIN_Ptkin11bG0090300 [Pterospermum kingtungense]